jgi:hypothetical protein
VERNHRLDSNQLLELGEELKSLKKKQRVTRSLAVYVGMSPGEAIDFDSRQERISRICAILSQHDLKQ